MGSLKWDAFDTNNDTHHRARVGACRYGTLRHRLYLRDGLIHRRLET